MPPRVTFWTGTWDPSREAISKEISCLRAATTFGSPVVAFSPGQRSRLLLRTGVIRLASRRWLTLRAAAAVIERWGDVTHVFGGPESWHLLRAVGRRPILLTVALPGQSNDSRVMGKVTLFVAESRAAAKDLVEGGIHPDRVALVYPGIDLDTYRAAPLPAGPFRVLFASSPADPAEFEARGIPLLIETARRRPGVEFVFLWRQWGSVSSADRALNELSPPANVRVEHLDASDMPSVYHSVHAVACCYQAGFGKLAPNSVIEGLACGRPALVSDTCGIADVIQEHGAGLAVMRNPDTLAGAIDDIQRRVDAYSSASRALAEKMFDVGGFRQRYARLYERLCRETPREGAPKLSVAGGR